MPRRSSAFGSLEPVVFSQVARDGAGGGHPASRPDFTVADTLALLCPLGQVEVRVLTDTMSVKRFTDRVAAETWITQLRAAHGIYVVMNPFDEQAITGAAVTDRAITRRAWLLIDCDPSRPAGTNATDSELATARAFAGCVKQGLGGRGWPDPVECCSGNGWHLLYSVDLPNDSASDDLVKRLLRTLSDQFNTPEVQVDRSVGNASRITKLYGTWARKGPHSPERPHRLSHIAHIPNPIRVVPLTDLQAVAGGPSPHEVPEPNGGGSRYDIGSVLARLEVQRTITKGETTYYEVRCPWAAEHTTDPDRGTVFTVGADGAVGFKCQHAHCADRHWPQLRERLGIKAASTPDEAVLREFRHFFITQLGAKDGGRRITMVGNDETFPPSFQTYEAFRQYHCDTRTLVGKTWTTRAKLWLEDPEHRKYVDVQFRPPPLPVAEGVLNLWQGYAVTPDPEPDPEQRCQRFLRHVREVICGGEDPDVAEFLLDVLAAKVQRPALLTEVAIVIRGVQGAGKNSLTEYYGGLFGRHSATVDKHELVTGRFNAVLSSKLVVVLDEAMWPGHKEFVGALKSLVTGLTLMIERKGIDPVQEPNFVQVVVLTNGDWAWPTELGDRRALILNVTGAHKGDTGYFEAYYQEMGSGGQAALLAFLMQRQISRDLRHVPHTSARDQQVALTDDDPVQSMWFGMLWRGTTWPEGEDWSSFISTKDLEEHYAEHCRVSRHRPLPQKLLLQRWHQMLPPAAHTHPVQRRVIDREVQVAAHKRGGYARDKVGREIVPAATMRRGTLVPDLEACRSHYAATVGPRVINWPESPASDVEGTGAEDERVEPPF